MQRSQHPVAARPVGPRSEGRLLLGVGAGVVCLLLAVGCSTNPRQTDMDPTNSVSATATEASTVPSTSSNPAESVSSTASSSTSATEKSGQDGKSSDTTAPKGAADPSARTPAGAGKVLWEDNINETGSLRNVILQQCAPGRIQVVTDPTGGSRKVAKMTVRDSDVAPCTPTENPRAQMLSPKMMQIGKEYWVGFGVYVPKDFPNFNNPASDWLAINSIYGPPYAGRSGNGYSLAQDSKGGPWFFSWKLGKEDNWKVVWKQVVPKGRWVDFVVHYKLDTKARGGYREQWINTGSGWQHSKLSNGTTKQAYDVISSANNGGPNESKVVLYHNKGALPTATLYFASHKVGTSFNAVAPTSYSAN